MLTKGSVASPELLGVIARHGDPAMEFIWKHKATLAGGAALTAFLTNPEPFINGTARLGETAAEHIIQPVVQDVAKPAVQGAVNTVSSLLWATFLAGLMASAGATYLAIKHPKVAFEAGRAVAGAVRATRR